MPVISTLASLSKNGYSGSGSTIPTTGYWLSIIDAKVNNNFPQQYLPFYISGLGKFASGMSRSSNPAPITYRATSVEFNDNDGVMSWYKLLADVTTSPVTPYFAGKDSIGYNYVVYRGGTIAELVIEQLDSAGNVVSSKKITPSTGSFIPSAGCMVIYNDNIYMAINYVSASGIAPVYPLLMKIDCATLTVQWNIILNVDIGGGFNIPNVYNLKLDKNGYLYMTAADPNGIDDYLVKFDLGGNLIWQRSVYNLSNNLQGRVDINANGDIYLLGNGTSTAGTARIIKISNAGTKSFERLINAGNVNISYDSISVNYNDTITVMGNQIQANLNGIVLLLFSTNGQTTLASKKLNYLNTATNLITARDIKSDGYFWYVSGYILNGAVTRTVGMYIKLPCDGTTPGTGSYNYNFTTTSSNGTNYSYNDTLTYGSQSGPTQNLVGSVVTVNITSYTTSTISISTSNTTLSTSAVVPFNYTLALS